MPRKTKPQDDKKTFPGLERGAFTKQKKRSPLASSSTHQQIGNHCTHQNRTSSAVATARPPPHSPSPPAPHRYCLQNRSSAPHQQIGFRIFASPLSSIAAALPSSPLLAARGRRPSSPTLLSSGSSKFFLFIFLFYLTIFLYLFIICFIYLFIYLLFVIYLFEI